MEKKKVTIRLGMKVKVDNPEDLWQKDYGRLVEIWPDEKDVLQSICAVHFPYKCFGSPKSVWAGTLEHLSIDEEDLN